MNTIKIFFTIVSLVSILFSQTSSITISGTGTAATSAHITVTTDGYKCPNEYIVEDGASLKTWDPAAICGATTSGAGDIALPVELAYFTAKAIMTGVQLEWRTESEVDNLGFFIDRKKENTDWQEIISYKTDDTLLGQGTASYATDYSFLDELVNAGETYEYRLADVAYDGQITYNSTRTVTVEQTPLSSTVEEFTVLPAYPNPFNPSTTIRYAIPQGYTEDITSVIINIYDITGKLITTLLNKQQSAGWHTVEWNGISQMGEKVPAGQYLIRIESENNIHTSKLMLLK